MIIRHAEIGDSLDILDWRNDSLSCVMSINDKKVDAEDHNKWFENSLNNPYRSLFIGIIAEKKVGVCRFDYDNSKKSSEVSINLNPAMRGKNLSFQLLSEAIKKYQEINQQPLLATIRKENITSIKLFEKCGFKQVNENNSFYFYILEYDGH